MTTVISTRHTKGEQDRKMEQIDRDFNIIEWLDAEQKKNEIDRIEFLEKHFSNGVLRYEYRTERDRVENCGRLIYTYTGIDGTEKEYKEFRCKVLVGENACPKCLSIRANQRSGDFRSRIDAVSDRQLYRLVAEDSLDMKRMRELCYRHGYKYLAVPTGNDGEKIVIVDGPVKGSSPVHPEDASNEIGRLGGFLSENRSLRVSGTLGAKTSDEDEKEDDVAARSVSVVAGGYVFIGSKEPTKAEKEIANVKAMVQARVDDSVDVITEENAQMVITERESVLDKIYLSMGYRRKRVADHKINVDVNEMNRVWSRIVLGKDSFQGDIRAVSPFSRMLISKTIDERNDTPDNFMTDIDRASRQFSL